MRVHQRIRKRNELGIAYRKARIAKKARKSIWERFRDLTTEQLNYEIRMDRRAAR